MGNILTVENVTKIIKKRTVLDNISIDIEEGKVYALFGANGSGKTMLLRMFSGLIHPTRGVVRYRDRILHKDIYLPPSIGIIIENPGLWPDLSGADNLITFARIKNIATKSDIKYWMEYFGLDHEDPLPVRKYSLGMRQKLGIAQAVMEKPEILLLDEPMNALDKESVICVKKLLINEKDRGATIVLTSHRDTDFQDIADVFIEMENGRLIEAPHGSEEGDHI